MQAFVLAHPPGAYTVLRCGAGVDADFHVARLLLGARKLFPTMTSDHVRSELVRLFQNARERHAATELLVVIVYARDGHLVVAAQYSPLPAPSDDVVALVVPARRSLADVKNSQWLRERRSLEALRDAAGAKEAILTTEQGHLLEGLVTNVFFVTTDGTLVTPPPNGEILAGGTRKLCIAAAREMGVAVEERAVHPLELARGCFRSAFLTSAVHVCTPIHRFLWSPSLSSEALAPGDVVLGGRDALVHGLRGKVLDALGGSPSSQSDYTGRSEL